MSEQKKYNEIDFPSNSREKKEKRQLEKVVSSPVRQKKRSFGKKMAETFLEDDTKSVTSYIIHDVLIPAAKAMISDMITGGIEMLLYGDRRGGRTRRDSGRAYTPYSSLYRSSGSDRDRPRDISRSARVRHNFEEIVIESRPEAEEVLAQLTDLILDYGTAKVADLYSLVGINENFTDHKWGWTDLDSADVRRVRDGYMLILPRPKQLD